MTTDHAPRFVYAARLDELPEGALRRVELEGRLIVLAHVGGNIYAADDDCPHISGPLDQGELIGCVLTCPIHLAQFDIRDGSVLRGPARDPLQVFPVRIDNQQVFVGLEDS